MDAETKARWIATPSMCKAAVAGGVLTCKTPLTGEAFDERALIQEATAVAKMRPGLVLDINNSSRYCSAKYFDSISVPYEKYKIPVKAQQLRADDDCHDADDATYSPPPLYINSVVHRLRTHMQDMERNSSLGPAVLFCKSGLNRTGYVVVHLLLRLHGGGMSVDEALRVFFEARGMEKMRTPYRNALYRYFEQTGCAQIDPSPAAERVILPSFWDHVAERVSDPEADEIRGLLADMLPGFRGFPGLMPATLEKGLSLSRLNDSEFVYTPKLDGDRYLCVSLGRWGVYLVDRRMAVRRVEFRFPGHVDMAILDGELMEDPDRPTGFIFHTFDLMALNWGSMQKTPFVERVDDLYRHVYGGAGRVLAHAGARSVLTLHMKRFYDRFSDVFPDEPNKTDGTIVYVANETYRPSRGRDAGGAMPVLKWKEKRENTVDFRVKRMRAAADDRFEYELQVSQGKKEHRTVEEARFVDTGIPFKDGDVVECSPTGDNNWVAKCVRMSKDANKFNTYRSALSAFRNPVTLEDVQRVTCGEQPPPPETGAASFKRFHSAVKRMLYRDHVFHHLRGARLLDFGCGYGPCVNSWAKALTTDSVATFVAYDPDATAALTAADSAQTRLREALNHSTVERDLVQRARFVTSLADIDAGAPPFDVVMANFCVHYLFADRGYFETGVRDLCTRVAAGGVVCVTIPDGSRIRALLETRPVYSNSIFKLGRVSDGPMTTFGSYITFHVDDTRYYRNKPVDDTKEPLADTEVLKAEFAKHGLQVERESGFDALYAKRRQNRLFCTPLSPDNLAVSRLYKLLVFRR